MAKEQKISIYHISLTDIINDIKDLDIKDKYQERLGDVTSEYLSNNDIYYLEKEMINILKDLEIEYPDIKNHHFYDKTYI